LFLLLQLDRYSDALNLISARSSSTTTTTTTTTQSLEFERAYCLYRLHREDEALNVIYKLKSSSEELGLDKEDGMGRKLTSLEGQIVSLERFAAPPGGARQAYDTDG
jgi:signal recognition particle subunit SRP72